LGETTIPVKSYLIQGVTTHDIRVEKALDILDILDIRLLDPVTYGFNDFSIFVLSDRCPLISG